MTQRLLPTLLALLLAGSYAFAQSNCGSIDILNPSTVNVCRGETVELRQTNTLNNPTLTWSPATDLLDGANDGSPRIRPQSSGYVKVTATAGGCTVVDSVFINVSTLDAPQLRADTTVCQGSTISLTRGPVAEADNASFLLLAGADTLRDATAANGFTVRADRATTYTLVSRTDDGVCEERATVRISVIRAVFDIQQDTVFACLGADSITLTVRDSPSVAAPQEILWRPSRFGNGVPAGNSFKVAPTADITYYAEATVNGCPRIDSVAVRLDSLPGDLSMMLDPEKDPYCQGDTFYILSPVYDAGDFPIIEHEWLDASGLQSPRDLYNAVYQAQDTMELRRVTTNGACIDTTSILVNVVEPPQVTFTPEDPVVCPGESVQIQATFETGSGTLTWMDPANTLSCTDCLDPLATVQTTTEYQITLESDSDECQTELSYTIEVVPNIEPTLTTEVLLCPGDSRQLIVGNTVPGYTYRITGGGIDTADPSVLVSPTTSTTYTIETNGDCGLSTQTIDLVVASDYTVTATAPENVCAGDPLTLTAAVDPSSITGTYTWTLADGVSTQTGQSITVADAQSGTYAVTFVDALGCASATDSVTVEVLGQNITPVVLATLPDGSRTGSGGSVFSGNDVVLTVTNLPAGLDYTYSWSGNYEPASGSGESLTVSVPRTADQPAPLSYTLTVTTTESGCTYQAIIVLTVEQSQVQAPDFFTPNGDGRNDGFRLFYNGTVTDYTMIVYDRWGQKVWTSEDSEEAWDGTKNGTPQPADVYLYRARFRQDGAELEEEGQVTLIR